jgi:5-oxoprolinase (ATP-hydrolysing)
MPVHLGSMDRESIKTVIRENKPARMQARRCLRAQRTLYHGGTHLPDITVMHAGVSDGDLEAAESSTWVASRGHHADIGGTTPGSMSRNVFHAHRGRGRARSTTSSWSNAAMLREAEMI